MSHGVDYVVIPDPPGNYVDRMPADGMRSFLQWDRPDTKYFTFVHATVRDEPYQTRTRVVTNGLRLYRVEPVTETR